MINFLIYKLYDKLKLLLQFNPDLVGFTIIFHEEFYRIIMPDFIIHTKIKIKEQWH